VASPRDLFRQFAGHASVAVGSPAAFVVAFLVILAWAVTGPLFHYSDTWQLVINTATTVVTFLMVFVIQNTQNRDNRALQLKLDELLHAVRGARDSLIDLEENTDDELDDLQREFRHMREERGGQAPGDLRSCPPGPGSPGR
jgi:low affinity Fe/Cu permease